MAANCTGTKTENDPLYHSIMVPLPEKHIAIGREVASAIERLNPAGQVSGSGRIVLAGGGMSNAKKQFDAFSNAYRDKYGRGRPATLVNLGTGNWPLNDMMDKKSEYRKLMLDTMVKKKVTPEQVQIFLFKNSIRFQDKEYPDDVNEYMGYLEEYREFLIDLFPNLRMWFVLAPVYSGYASKVAPRQEPFVFREGLAVDEFVRRHDRETRPWIGWGPYYWNNGIEARGDGLVWNCKDFMVKDGVHPSTDGLKKTTDMLMRFFENSPVTGWFKGVEIG